MPIPGDESIAEGFGIGEKVLKGVDCVKLFTGGSVNTGCED